MNTLTRNLIFFSVLIHCSLISLYGQETAGPIVCPPVYFDISPPLRNIYFNEPAKADRSWKEGSVPNFYHHDPKVDSLREMVQDTVVQGYFGKLWIDTTLQNFDGIDNVNNVVPPDTYGDIGPSHYFQLVNLSFAIYTREGQKLLGPVNTSTIWEGLPHNYNNGDGVVLYDEQADRWLISQFSFPAFPEAPFYQMVAVSQTPDPTGSWFRWEFRFDELPDYPKFGVWPDGYYMSYTRIKPSSLQFAGVGVVALNREDMIAGKPDPLSVSFTISSLNSPTFLPADCDGPFPPAGTPEYYGYTMGNYFAIREFHVDWNNPSLSTFGDPLKLPVAPYKTLNSGIPQKDSDKTLTALSDRLMYRLQFRNFRDYMSMVVNQTVDAGPSTGIRWYELRKTSWNWFIYQQATFAPDSNYRWMGSIAMDTSGNIALGYSVCDSDMYPSIRITGRMKNDPPGQMTIREMSITEGTGSQTGIWFNQGRWGDYSSMTVDPLHPSVFWYTQEYYKTTSFNGWSTRIASFSFTDIMRISASAYPVSICDSGEVLLNVDVSGGTGEYIYSWTSIPPGFISDLKDPVAHPATNTKFIVRVTSGSITKSDTITVSVIPSPLADAGNDTTLCRYVTSLPVSGTSANNISVNWETTGDGTFDDPDALNTIYHPGINDKSSGNIFLILTSYPSYPCQPVSSMMELTFDTCAGIFEKTAEALTADIYPNPVFNMMTAVISGTKMETRSISVIDILNNVFYSEDIVPESKTQTIQVNLSNLPRGLYFFKVKTRSATIVKPFVKQ